jgi:hypothetical protein
MNDYTTPEGDYTDLATQFGPSSLADVPVPGKGFDDDRLRVTRPERRPTTKPRTPEKVMVTTRRSVVMNHDENADEHCFVDNVDALSLELAKKAIQRQDENDRTGDRRYEPLHGPGRYCGHGCEELDCDCYAQYLFRDQRWGLGDYFGC